MAVYVVEKKLGIQIDRLLDLGRELANVSDDKYKEMLRNVRTEKERLVNGQSLGEIVKSIL